MRAGAGVLMCISASRRYAKCGVTDDCCRPEWWSCGVHTGGVSRYPSGSFTSLLPKNAVNEKIYKSHKIDVQVNTQLA